jgi:5-methylcytosine-specific restriction endonuclease McrA
VPLLSGGTDDITNIQPLCAKCNSRKGIAHTDYRKRGH